MLHSARADILKDGTLRVEASVFLSDEAAAAFKGAGIAGGVKIVGPKVILLFHVTPKEALVARKLGAGPRAGG